MTDAEISRRLALAIGWKAHEGRIYHTGTAEQRVEVRYTPRHAPAGHKIWRRFDYRDPAVIWPIAEKFNLFPRQTLTVDVWACQLLDGTRVLGNTAAKAVALAVIAAKGG